MKMLIKRLWIVAFLAVFAYGCEQVLTNEYPYGEEITLAPEQRALVGGESLIRVLGVEDGRCPIPVNCFWEGNAKVDLELRISGYAPVRFALNTYGYREFIRDTTINGVKIELLDVSPYPRHEQPTPQSDYRVQLRVSR